MKRCEQCGRPESFPSVEELGITLQAGDRGWVTARMYAVLQQSGGVTLDGLCKAAWPDGEPRAEGTIHVMLSRLDRRLARHGLAIAKVGIWGSGEKTYRLVGL